MATACDERGGETAATSVAALAHRTDPAPRATDSNCNLPDGHGQTATRLDSHLSRHTYHGHRRTSFTTKDIDELTELRARRESVHAGFERALSA